ncbi:nucleoporin FG repeat-containing protein [Aspergillus melleus]|uniref:nucleoporin FG repeat-containing protein n=1 Tax=Aspergillus melleus TaxID=138277 RepID=UPI001E8E4907|nr:Nucleoporin nup49/NSP49 (Nuclear pore protein nup49/NSP49) [Aspergillus melleus]KAH8425036.1 Nucleoporin nup49/NSP49 (Nuclear pore protein nup49/NSP49) [Aspergillus melleus]
MFSAKPAGGLSINTNSANSLFGGANNAQTSSSTATPGSTTTSGLFGNLGGSTPQSKPAGGLFGNTLGGGNTQQTQSGSSLFGGLGGQQQQQQNNKTCGGVFGNTTPAASQPQTNGLFGGTAGANNTMSAQPKPAFGLGGSTTTGGGLLGSSALNNTQTQQQQQQQQPQKPTLSLFGNQNQPAAQQAPPPSTLSNTVVPGVIVDISNLLPTTKFESCASEIKAELERFDNAVLAQIQMCNEIANMIPSIAAQGETIPNDVEFVQGKLETMQHALENDAGDIDQLRGLVARDAAEAQVAFRAIDTLKLPLQFQSAGGPGWWSVQDQKMSDRQSLRSSRKNTLALPDDVEADPSTATAINGVPVNLVDYFSQRSDDMGGVLDQYTQNLKDIEDHLHGVESTLERQIHEFLTSRSRDGTSSGASKTVLSDLTAVLGDVEAGILGVASRLGQVTEQAQEVVLGPPSVDGRLGL